MRKILLCFVMVLLCGPLGFGQNVPPQWKVVQVVTLIDQLTPVPTTTLFTPSEDGFYRITAYIGVLGTQQSEWTLNLQWFDISGQHNSTNLIVGIQVGDNRWANFSAMFMPAPSIPVTYSVTLDLGTATNYFSAITIEKLE